MDGEAINDAFAAGPFDVIISGGGCNTHIGTYSRLSSSRSLLTKVFLHLLITQAFWTVLCCIDLFYCGYPVLLSQIQMVYPGLY